ncbi:acetylornithine deacetylase/succinyl-diaminopimelate desuccinylase-like protein [Arthrobacter sp. UYCu723]
MVWRTWSSNVSGWWSSPLIAGIWPAVNTKPLATTAWELANVTVERNHAHSWPVTPYQPEGVELAAKVAADLGLANKQVMTLAGHDSTNMKDLAPTVMLFVPSVDGISHNEHEYTTDEDIVAGLTMLTEVVNRLCNGVLED